MSSIAHHSRSLRTGVHRKVWLSLMAAVLVAAVAIVLVLAADGSDADRTAPTPSLGHAAPSQAYDAPAKDEPQAPMPCCGHRP